MIRGIRRLFYKLINWLYLCRHSVFYGKNLVINGNIHLCGSKITFGDNVRINSGNHYNPIGGDTRTVLATHANGSIKIGNNVGMSNCALVARESIVIENDVMIGGGVKIYDTDFHSLVYDERMQKLDKDIKSVPVLIKKGAFIGAHSIILKGVTIGEKAIVGAGSVVSKDIPEMEIWGGNPARFIKRIGE